MTESNASPKGAVQIRCPNCGGMVQMPAENCPACRYDFRTGLAPEEEGGRARVWLLGGLVLAAVVILAAVFFFKSGEPMSSAPPLPPTAGAVPDSEIGEALATLDQVADAPAPASRPFENLSDDPLVLQAKPIVDTSREVAAEVEGQQEQRDEFLESNE